MSLIRLARNGLRFWRTFGTRHLLRELQRRLTTPLPPGMTAAAIAPPEAENPRSQAPISAQQLLTARFAQASALPVFVVPRTGRPRISVVTDSINKGSLFGGVGTAMIVAALLVQQRGARLRIVTRTEPAHAANLHTVLQLYGLSVDDEVEFAFAHVQAQSSSLNVFADELFITTSWWTTASTLAAVAPSRILYVLQEDERMFYPGGDDQLQCARLLAHEQLHVAVNTQGLLDHLIQSGLPHLERTALAFEPAFPASVYRRQASPQHRQQEARSSPHKKRRLLFYARPNHLRNLFYFGLEVLDAAVARGVVDTQQWDIMFVGAHAPAVILADGTVPERHENLSWQAYAELAGTIDVGLCLMYTPHPSYPPMDLAASGAVVVTNRFGNKTSLAACCENILCADLTVDAMLLALQEALRLASDEAERSRRFAARRMATDWTQTLQPLVKHFSQADDVWA
jgi:O-antigen biosynthesis protein